MKKIILFLNGEPPKKEAIPNLADYDQIICADGAYNYLQKYNITPDLILGDLDSISTKLICPKFIPLPNQDYTDFEKILMYLSTKTKVRKIDIYGGSAREQDHFLGNLYVAKKYRHKFKITFYDQYQSYFFAKKETVLKNVKNKTISLLPLFYAAAITTQGLKWPLKKETLSFSARLGLRNIAMADTVQITFDKGCLLVFVEQN
ncbi:thiamine diphosphokinase [bacterium]|jgi:thiamine pyrophosphokinase|nr:thiamine diphosphokinase [bacterium]MBT3581897.1 thiamine diphosphokinase [bacterium]MBT4552715.1 thiamine diphosphokinase [bacterium]MBT5989041.1 thiamine diphosphokinase [bacterium]MBT7087363.1 thiamine diphosphokinase [bacterium]